MRTKTDERGAALPLIALCVVVILLGSGFTIDLGSLAAKTRRLQALSDLIALDTAAELGGQTCTALYQRAGESTPSSTMDHLRAAAVASSVRNGHVVAGTKTLVVEPLVLERDTGPQSFGAVVRDSDGRPKFRSVSTCENPTSPDFGAKPDAVRVFAGDRVNYGFSKVVGFSGANPTRRAISTDGSTNSLTPQTPVTTTPPSSPSTTVPPPPDDDDDDIPQPQGAFILGSTALGMTSDNATLLNEILTVGFCSAYQVPGAVTPGGSTTGPVNTDFLNNVGGATTVGPVLTGPCKVNFSVVGYQGLAATNVKLGDVATALGFGSPQALLTSNINVGTFLRGAANAVDCTGQPASCPTAKLSLFDLGVQLESKTTATASEGKLFHVLFDSNGGTAAAALKLDLFDVLTATAQVINGANFISLGNSSVNVPGLSNTRTTVDVIESPRRFEGGLGTLGTTSQTRVTIDSDVSTSYTVTYLNALGLSVNLPATLTTHVRVTATGGNATGKLSGLRCKDPTKGIDVEVQIGAVAETIDLATGTVTLATTPVASSVTVTLGATSAPPAAANATLSFLAPTEYKGSGGVYKHVGSTSLGFGSSTVTVGIVGSGSTLPGVNAGVVSSTSAALASLLGLIDTTLITPLSRELGLDIGSADVIADEPLKCGVPGLAG